MKVDGYVWKLGTCFRNTFNRSWNWASVTNHEYGVLETALDLLVDEIQEPLHMQIAALEKRVAALENNYGVSKDVTL